MWLSAMSYPDHDTINRFRSDRLKGVLKEVFSHVVLLLVEKGIVTLKIDVSVRLMLKLFLES
jgi:transposase